MSAPGAWSSYEDIVKIHNPRDRLGGHVNKVGCFLVVMHRSSALLTILPSRACCATRPIVSDWETVFQWEGSDKEEDSICTLKKSWYVALSIKMI